MLAKLLVIDNDVKIRTLIKWSFEQDYEVLFAEDRESALAAFKGARPKVVMLDLRLPPYGKGVEEGFRALTDLLQLDPYTKIIVITGQEGREPALRAISLGAYDFLRKPIQIDELKVLIRRALYVYRMERQHRDWLRKIPQESLGGLLGSSPAMQAVFTTIRRVATTDASVLISGESGTGKELVARAIHRQSVRHAAPLVVINCGAIPENLLESELFGHEKGVFTGAHAQQKGRIELAQGGTLFLDEVGELSPPLQVKLLRFLQERQLERVGGRETIDVDVRVVAATKVDLEQAILHEHFREDLYYRLAVVRLTLPPLRDRGQDVVLLAKALLQGYASKTNNSVNGFDRSALLALQNHRWPGNVRELENRIQRALIMAEGSRLTPKDLELVAAGDKAHPTTLKEAREALEKELISQGLTRNDGNISRAAAELGVTRPTLHDLMAKYQITV